MRKEEEKFREKPVTKDSIREDIKKKRQKLSREEVEEKSKLIKEKLFSLPEFQAAKTVAFYVALKKNNEVETEEMIRESLKMGKRVLVPITDLIENNIIFSEITNFDDLVLGSFGIMEPLPEIRKIYPYEVIRLAIVPGVAFDLEGHRLGYGLGFYDNFLSKLTKYIPKIGLAFEMQIIEKLPKESHDVKLDKVITEEQIIE